MACAELMVLGVVVAEAVAEMGAGTIGASSSLVSDMRRIDFSRAVATRLRVPFRVWITTLPLIDGSLAFDARPPLESLVEERLVIVVASSLVASNFRFRLLTELLVGAGVEEGGKTS